MNKQLHIISAVENIERFVWETKVQLHNLSKYNLVDKFRLLIFLPAYQSEFLKGWKELEQEYPKAKFFYYTDPKNKVTDLMVNYQYQPIHRLCSLEKHFKEHPELEKAAIFYIDSDVILTKDPTELYSHIDDDVNYLSDTHTYLNEEYLSSKINDVDSEKKEEYKKANIIAKAASFAGLTLEDLKVENKNTGGAQYLLKNISCKFFSQCIDVCLVIRMYFQTVNQQYFPGNTVIERENKGIQSWCADMFAIQWLLWRHKLPSQTPKWMDFAWATDEISKLDSVFMMHNAGIDSSERIRITENLKTKKDENDKPIYIDAPALDKNRWKNMSIFSSVETLENIINDEHSKKYCTSVYTQAVLDTIKNK